MTLTPHRLFFPPDLGACCCGLARKGAISRSALRSLPQSCTCVPGGAGPLHAGGCLAPRALPAGCSQRAYLGHSGRPPAPAPQSRRETLAQTGGGSPPAAPDPAPPSLSCLLIPGGQGQVLEAGHLCLSLLDRCVWPSVSETACEPVGCGACALFMHLDLSLSPATWPLFLFLFLPTSFSPQDLCMNACCSPCLKLFSPNILGNGSSCTSGLSLDVPSQRNVFCLFNPTLQSRVGPGDPSPSPF